MFSVHVREGNSVGGLMIGGSTERGVNTICLW